MLVRFSHVMIYSQSHREAVNWYCDKLGFEIDYHAPGEYASLHHQRLGRIAIHAATDGANIGRGPMPYLLCEDIRQTIADLVQNGVRVSEPRREGESPWFATFFDLDGNAWGIEEM